MPKQEAAPVSNAPNPSAPPGSDEPQRAHERGQRPPRPMSDHRKRVATVSRRFEEAERPVADLKRPSAGFEGADQETPAVADLKRPSPAVADLKKPSAAVVKKKSEIHPRDLVFPSRSSALATQRSDTMLRLKESFNGEETGEQQWRKNKAPTTPLNALHTLFIIKTNFTSQLLM
ncbi:hypothetical protein Syun_023968 [Stephania yunnanensis]|uniref:Uncharacterized protein n=1 Tax=Stephania yunnanensis TaxID=152371 RepID=A0AAP0FKB4_9MAGN